MLHNNEKHFWQQPMSMHRPFLKLISYFSTVIQNSNRVEKARLFHWLFFTRLLYLISQSNLRLESMSNKVLRSVATLFYAEIKHSNWFKLANWLPSIQRESFILAQKSYSKTCLWLVFKPCSLQTSWTGLHSYDYSIMSNKYIWQMRMV